MQSLQKIL